MQLADSYRFLMKLQNSDERLFIELNSLGGDTEKQPNAVDEIEVMQPDETKQRPESDTATDDCEYGELMVADQDDDEELQNVENNKLPVSSCSIPTYVAPYDKRSNVVMPHFVVNSADHPATFGTFEMDEETGALTQIPAEPSSSSAFPHFKSLDVCVVRLNGVDRFGRGDAATIMLNSQPASSTPDNVSTYVCRYCPRGFSTPHHLIKHTRKSHVCQFCLEGFVKSTDLQQHVRDTHNEFRCPFCPRMFAKNGSLRAHIKRVHNVQLPANVSLLTLTDDEMVAT